MDALIGRTLGHHMLLHYLAHGGMSEIYLACDKRNMQICALKIVREADEEQYLSFQREVQALCGLKHPHIVPLLDMGSQDGWGYYVMPYIEQGTLKTRLEHGPLALEEAGTILTQVADALHFLHETGIAHGDVKPANILLDADGHAWLADFGLAQQHEGESDLTGTSTVCGTPLYMAPELTSTSGCVSSDIYALGVVLYEMLTGHVPFDGPGPLAICWKHINERPPAPSTFNPAISLAIEAVILCALEKHPQQRFRTVWALARAYQEALTMPDAPIQATLPVVNAGLMTLHIQPRWAAFHIPFPFLTKPQVCGLIAAFIVLTLLIIMSMISLSTITPSAQRTIHVASDHATPAITVPSLKKNAGSGTRETPAPRSHPRPNGQGYHKSDGHQSGKHEIFVVGEGDAVSPSDSGSPSTLQFVPKTIDASGRSLNDVLSYFSTGEAFAALFVISRKEHR